MKPAPKTPARRGRKPVYPWDSTPVGGHLLIRWGSIQPQSVTVLVARQNRKEAKQGTGRTWCLLPIAAGEDWKVYRSS